MATVTRRIEVCDICREVDNPVVTHVRIAPENGRLRTYAFCAGDYQPVQAVLTAIAKATPATDGRRSKQVTMEQIEQIKANASTTKRGPGRPRKKAAAAAS